MYVSLRDRPRTAVGARRAVGRNVVLLGLVSLFTDVSSEMVVAVLPLYMIAGLGLTPLHVGLVDGVYQGVTSLVRVLGGVVSDRWQRHKEVAATGYGVSAAAKLGLLAAGSSWPALTAVVAVDRLGKGVRTAPRDALISLSTPAASLGTAFGVHRALDTTGALLGPVAAFVLLTALPGRFDAVFVVSFCVALVGFGLLVLFVDNHRTPATDRPAVSWSLVGDLVADRRVRAVLAVGPALALATIGDAFVYLVFQRRLGFGLGMFPLLYVGTAAVYLLLAVPAGRLADRVGRARVFIGGHLLLLGVDVTLLVPGPVALVLGIGLLGGFYAATDGVLMALASGLLPERARASGLALLTTGTALARGAAALAFGAVWTWWGATAAVLTWAGALLVALPFAATALRRAEVQPS